MISLIGLIILVFIDQVAKRFAETYLKGTEGIDLIPKVFRLQYLENFGAAFGSLQHATVFFIVLTSACLVVILCVFVRIPLEKRFVPLQVVAVFFTAGAVGNFIDRLTHRYVIDFLYFVLIDFPVFNIADIYVTCSSVVFFILFLFYYKEEDFSFLKRG
ncbi:signal peptidase II [Lachnospiraceae bacterium XBB1006]|nr:signal peptidase II [Lachnospiraceae bacterium XBB1006]